MNIRKDYGVPVLLPGKSHGWRSLEACSPWGCWGLDSNFTFTFHFHALEKEMATRSSVLAWRIPGMGEPGGLPSMGLHRVGHNWRDSSSSSSMGFLPERLLPAEGLDRTVATRSNLSNVLPGGSDGKESICNVGDLGSILGSGKIPWRREWLPTAVFLFGEPHGQRSLVGYCLCVSKESDMTGWLTLLL